MDEREMELQASETRVVGEGQALDVFLEETAQKADFYVEYLASVNATNEVQATSDICNQKGILLVKSGSRIDGSVAEKILRHKLTQPLEDQVELKDQLDGERLRNHFHALLKRYPDLATIHAALGFEEQFRDLLFHASVNSRLRQKMTVFQDRMPDYFESGIFGGWLGALLCRELGFDKEGVRSAFFAGFVRDLGFLHIDPKIVFKKGVLLAEEWRAIMGHVVVGNLFLSSLSGTSPTVIRAVMEHHERCDGTGYPAGKQGDRLSVLGNVIGLVDTLQAIRTKQFVRHGRNMMDARPYLQLNNSKHSPEVGQAMLRLLQKSGLRMTSHDEQDIELIAARLQDRLVAVQKSIPLLSRLITLADEHKLSGAGAQSLVHVSVNVVETIRRSGLDREELVDWSRSVEHQPDAGVLDELNEMELLANELMWQLKSVYRSCRQFGSEQDSSSRVIDEIGLLCTSMEEVVGDA